MPWLVCFGAGLIVCLVVLALVSMGGMNPGRCNKILRMTVSEALDLRELRPYGMSQQERWAVREIFGSWRVADVVDLFARYGNSASVAADHFGKTSTHPEVSDMWSLLYQNNFLLAKDTRPAEKIAGVSDEPLTGTFLP